MNRTRIKNPRPPLPAAGAFLFEDNGNPSGNNLNRDFAQLLGKPKLRTNFKIG